MRQTVCVLMTGLLVQGLFAAELPVRKVILYKHGIGYFERGGEIPAGQSARLDFKAAEMNDVLKSLTIFDQSGNSVAGVRYDSSLPLASKLAEFPFKLGERATLADFLDQLKGAKIALKFGATAVEGQIVGARLMQSREKAQTSSELVSVLNSNGEIVTLDLAAANSVKLADPELQVQLSEYLRSLNASRSREQKSVYIDSARDAARKLRVAYTIPMPVWKSSYRLVLDSGDKKKPVLEGWAILDNTTNEDWTRVDLSVISGRPVSFVSRLYDPKFVQRQVAELEEDKPLAPKAYRGAMATLQAPPPVPAMGKGIAGGAPGGVMGGIMADSANRAEMAEMATKSSVQVDTVAREAGELFEYKFGQPVSVKRNESVMLPFVQEEVNARKLLIYTEHSDSENPLNSAELTNSTGKTLDGGPLSVYDGGVYAGEALVNTFKAGDKRLLSYASDLGTRVSEDEQGGEQVVRTIKANRGVITVSSTIERTKTYRITNVDRKPKTLIIEHAIVEGRKLQGAQPAEQTKTHYRFEVKLTGEAGQTFVVKQEEALGESYQISQASDEQIGIWVGAKSISAEAKRVLGEIASLRRQVAEVNRTIATLNQQSSTATADQDRVRRNLASLNSVSGQQERVQRYAADLANLDAKILTLRDQIEVETKKRDALNQQLSQRIDTANF